ncbi:MAG: Ig-like domain-containing protein [Clostridia bacterium]
MKLKKILALAVSLAMVLTMVPAFSLVANAAGTTGVIDALGGSVLWACPDGSFNDTAIGTAFSGWSSSITSGYVNVKTYSVGNVIQYYVNGTANVTTITSPGYGGEGEDALVIEWIMKRQNPSDLYFDFSFTDKNGTEIAFLKLDKNYTSVTGEYYMGYPAEGTDCAIVATNNGDGTHKVEYYVAGSVVSTIASKEGEISGFGGITSSNGRWSTAWNHIGFANLTIGAVSFSATKVDVTATYTANGETVKTATGSYDTEKGETGKTFDAYSYSANGSNVMYHTDGATLSESGDIVMDVVTNNGTYALGECFMYDSSAYEVASGNLVPNGDFAYGTAGWYNGAGGQAGFFASNGDGTMTLTAGGTGAGGDNSLYRAWAIETGKTYLFTFDASATNGYDKVSVKDDISATADGTVILDGGKAGTNQIIFTAANSYIQVNFRWLGSGDKFGNFGLYELADASAKVASTTIKFVDAEGTELQTAKTVAGFIGDVIDLTDTAVVPETITYNGNLYSKDASNPASHTVATAADEVTVTYSTDAVTSISTASATVIDGHTPLLPTTLAATTGTGAETTVNVTSWDTSSLTVGSNTVYGTVEGLELKAEATVTVLPETFALADKTTVNGQTEANNNVTAFPASITDSFVMEMDIVVESYGDLFITLKTAADTGFFGPEQIALGFEKNSGAFRPVNGNGSGGRTTADADLFAITAGTTYHLQVVSDPAQHKYTATIFDDNGNSAVAENFGYRTNADSIGYLAMLTNNGAGAITATSIKVYNATLEASKAEYTVVTIVDGVEESRTTGTFISADAITAAEREGYVLTKTVEGNTVTFTYVSTKTVDVKFVNANDDVIYSDSQVVSKDGSFTVSAMEIFALDASYNGAFYQIPETVVDVANMVVVVSETANKYAAMEDMLVSDNEVWGMKATNSNSVFVAAGADANRGPEYDANGASVTDGSHTPSLLGKSRVGFFQFPVVDVTEGAKVTANFYVRTWHGNGFSNGNTSLRLAATVINDDSWTTLTDGGDYDSANAPVFEGWTSPIFSNAHGNYNDYITFDITEAMMAAKSAGLTTITLRLNTGWGAAYIAEREAAVLGGAYEGKAAYIEVSDAGLVKVTADGAAELTKNGSSMNGVAYVAATDDVRLNATGAIVVSTDAGYYYANKAMSIDTATDFANTEPKGLGLAMVDGAQVRIGEGTDEDGKLLADSGLRFLATADKTDTVVGDGVEFGIKLTADGSSSPAYVKATNFQDEAGSVFSVAITNLSAGNYNRPYTATAYAKVTMADDSEVEFNSASSVTRSIYQVSAGIMKNNVLDGGEYANAVNSTIIDVLNAYINSVGVRVDRGETWTADDVYTGDVFFTVSSVTDGDVTTVTVTPDDTWANPVKIASWWKDYVRVNNNHSTAVNYIEGAVDENGVLTFTFTVPASE